jgi:hypothetical protein
VNNLLRDNSYDATRVPRTWRRTGARARRDAERAVPGRKRGARHVPRRSRNAHRGSGRHRKALTSPALDALRRKFAKNFAGPT